MPRHYKTHIQIDLRHQYYASKVCADFELTPTPETAAFFRGNRLLFGTKNRKQPSSVELLREYVDDNNPLLPLPDYFLLRFELSLRNPDFETFTTLPTKRRDQIYLLKNVGTSLVLDVMDAVAGEVRLDGLTANEILTVSMPNGTTFPIQAYYDGSSWKANIDFGGKPAGIYAISSSLPARQIYVHAQESGKTLFGLLHLQQGGGETLRPTYTFQFAVKTTKWKYFFRLLGNHSQWDYELTAPGLSFGEYTFPSGAPKDVGNIIKAMAAPSETVIGFESGDIECSDVVRSSIVLKRKLRPGAVGYPGSAVIVLKDLPNPSLGAAIPTVVMAVDPPR